MNRKKSKAFVPSTSATSPAPIAVAVIVAEPEALARELGREAAAQVGVLGPVLLEQDLENPAPLRGELEMPTTLISAADIGSNLRHLSSMLALLQLVLEQPKEAGKTVASTMKHAALLAQLSAALGVTVESTSGIGMITRAFEAP